MRFQVKARVLALYTVLSYTSISHTTCSCAAHSYQMEQHLYDHARALLGCKMQLCGVASSGVDAQRDLEVQADKSASLTLHHETEAARRGRKGMRPGGRKRDGGPSSPAGPSPSSLPPPTGPSSPPQECPAFWH